MKNSIELIKSLYLGDRYIEKLTWDFEKKTFEIQINLISFSDAESGEWSFDSSRGIEHGVLIFSGVKSVEFMDNKNFPNDQINEIVVDEIDNALGFKVFADSISESGENIESHVEIVADEVSLSTDIITK
ncbi:DUF6258 family protein [Pseudoalteromonas agarivorans]|uniref:DUF6258 family protein n=1 Tax=Pseudoalteromonas agarivorans TaxID=176102 RepID=UPI0003D5A519|nr:DUF6258 family protein [Pseudoalteromonas agarivorans]ETJ46841.1 hypothetical protein X564_17450 [Pseudoalteromonas agarivorans]